MTKLTDRQAEVDELAAREFKDACALYEMLRLELGMDGIRGKMKAGPRRKIITDWIESRARKGRAMSDSGRLWGANARAFEESDRRDAAYCARLDAMSDEEFDAYHARCKAARAWLDRLNTMRANDMDGLIEEYERKER